LTEGLHSPPESAPSLSAAGGRGSAASSLPFRRRRKGLRSQFPPFPPQAEGEGWGGVLFAPPKAPPPNLPLRPLRGRKGRGWRSLPFQPRHAERAVAGIHVGDLAGDPGGQVGAEEGGGIAHVLD